MGRHEGQSRSDMHVRVEMTGWYAAEGTIENRLYLEPKVSLLGTESFVLAPA